MKNLILKSCLVACLLIFTVSCSDDDSRRINHASLPEAAHTFLSTHFPSTEIRWAEKEKSARHNGSIYDVTLANGVEVDFDVDGNWTEVDCNYTAVPTAIIPEKIQTYVTANYPSLFIVHIEKEILGYDVELSNDLDLVFSPEGDFVRRD